MLARKRDPVPLVGSVAGFIGLPDGPACPASRAVLWACGEALRAAPEPPGRRVTVVARVERALLRGERRVVLPWVVGAALRGLALLPAPVAGRLERRSRFRIAPER